MTTHSKNYASAPNAKRAAEAYAKALGIAQPTEGDHYRIDPDPTAEGRFTWAPLNGPTPDKADAPTPVDKTEAGAKPKRKAADEGPTAKKAPRKGKAGDDQPKKDGPVAQVWLMCESMPGAPRKAVVEACVAAGINIHTAKTQYQRWFSAQKNA